MVEVKFQVLLFYKIQKKLKNSVNNGHLFINYIFFGNAILLSKKFSFRSENKI